MKNPNDEIRGMNDEKPPVLVQHGIECDHLFWFYGNEEE